MALELLNFFARPGSLLCSTRHPLESCQPLAHNPENAGYVG